MQKTVLQISVVAVLLVLAGCSPAMAQARLDDYPCLRNSADKYHVIVQNVYANDTTYFKLIKFYARCIDTTCADLRSPEEIALLLSGLENPDYDWSCNLALYELYRREVGLLLSVKPRQWRKHYRAADIAKWRELTKESPPPPPPPYKPLHPR